MGLCLNTPVSLAVTTLYEHVDFSWWYIFGSVLAFTSFLGIALTDWKIAKRRAALKKEEEPEFQRVLPKDEQGLL